VGDLAFWLNKIAKLKIDRAHGDPAPHKPLLLLVVLDLAEQNELPEILSLSSELAFRFYTYWSIVASRRSQRPDIRLPFHHLQTDGFWSAVDKRGYPSPDKKLTHFARLSSDFYQLTKDPGSRDKLRHILIATYFRPSEQIALSEAVGLPAPSKSKIEQKATYETSNDAKKVGREARFRLNVVAAYNYTCALTGYRLTNIMAGSIVDAAHIHKFADSRNNDPRNGIALCKNAHWSFDYGLWTVSDDYRIIVAVGKFKEESPNGRSLMEYHDQKLRLPSDLSLWPNPLHLAWHRQNKFLGI
jgi:putative restriction endonuclease